MRARALPVAWEITVHSWYCESCVFGELWVGASRTCNALRAHQHDIGEVTDQTVLKDVFTAFYRHFDINHATIAIICTLEQCGIIALFFFRGSWCRMHFGTTALGLFKRLGKFSVVMRTGHAGSECCQGMRYLRRVVRVPQLFSQCDRRVYGSPRRVTWVFASSAHELSCTFSKPSTMLRRDAQPLSH